MFYNNNVDPASNRTSFYIVAIKGRLCRQALVQVGSTRAVPLCLFYGTKKMWPLIVKHNSDKIKSPDHVPYGTKVKIPELALR